LIDKIYRSMGVKLWESKKPQKVWVERN